MANIRSFKKDIQFVVSELVIECLTYEILFPGKNEAEITGILSDLVSLQDALFEGINRAKTDKGLPIGKAMKNLRREFHLQTSAIIDKIGTLNLQS